MDAHQAFHPLGSVHLDHIKAGLIVPRILAEPKLRRGQQPLLLGPGHKLPRRSIVRVFPQLDLHEGKHAPLFGNDLDLPVPAALVEPQDPPAAAAQIIGRLLLAPGAEKALFLPAGQCIFLKKLSRWMGLGPYSRKAS